MARRPQDENPEEAIIQSIIDQTDPHRGSEIGAETGEVEPFEHDFDIEDAQHELAQQIERAKNFMETELAPEWEQAQHYYNGGTSLPEVQGRSKVVSTKVANAIRGARPSLLRIFLSSSAIVEFQPTLSHTAAMAHQQSMYCNHLFWQSGGYRLLHDIVQNAALKKIAPVKWWYERETKPETYQFTGLPEEEFQRLQAFPEVEIVWAESYDEEHIDEAGNPGYFTFYDCEAIYQRPGGQIRIEAIPLAEFFIDRNAKSVETARVVGHSRNMHVGDVIAMGIPEDALDGLDGEDQESTHTPGESEKRRGYVVEHDDTQDPMMREVLITEVYARFDLEGKGRPQLYRFLLGGTSYEYLTHEAVEEVQMEVICIDFEPHTVIGKSLFDILKQDQDTATSLLRATVDNAHAANNTRLAVHESMVNMGDVLSTKIAHPIRFRAPGMIQEIKVQSSAGAMLPLMQYLDQQTDNKAGVTQAAMGLDPDALQSTDKEAVRNTIALSQGQVEVMARNIAEGLRRVFAGILKLSIRHLPRQQLIDLQGDIIPVDQALFDPGLHMQPSVGIGSGNVEQKIQALQFALQRQETIMTTLGPANPFCDFSHIYNTQEDMLKLMGVHNVGRYFRQVTPEMGQQFAQQMAQSMAEAEAKKIDPQDAYLQAENIKAQTQKQIEQMRMLGQQRLEALKQQYDALVAAAEDDLKRDELAQKHHLEMAKIVAQYGAKDRSEQIRREQNAPRVYQGPQA